MFVAQSLLLLNGRQLNGHLWEKDWDLIHIIRTDEVCVHFSAVSGLGTALVICSLLLLSQRGTVLQAINFHFCAAELVECRHDRELNLTDVEFALHFFVLVFAEAIDVVL